MTPASRSLRSKLLRRGTDPERLARQLARRPEAIDQLIEGLASPETSIKFNSSRILRAMSGVDPKALYPHIELFVSRLACENKFLRCDAILTLANLAAADEAGKVAAAFDTFFAPIDESDPTVAATVVKAAANLALARPDLTEDIVERLLLVQGGRYPTDESRDVMLGQLLESLHRFFSQIEDRGAVLRMARVLLKNERPLTRRKATAFLAKWAPPATGSAEA